MYSYIQSYIQGWWDKREKNGFRVCERWDEEEKIDLGFVREQS